MVHRDVMFRFIVAVYIFLDADIRLTHPLALVVLNNDILTVHEGHLHIANELCVLHRCIADLDLVEDAVGGSVHRFRERSGARFATSGSMIELGSLL